jgi:hypothetical protein
MMLDPVLPQLPLDPLLPEVQVEADPDESVDTFSSNENRTLAGVWPFPCGPLPPNMLNSVADGDRRRTFPELVVTSLPCLIGTGAASAGT